MKTTFLVPGIAFILLASCGHKEVKPAASTTYVLSDSMQHLITLDSVRSSNITDQVTLTGQVSFNENSVVKVFPRSSGQVLQAPLSLGDHVSRGQVLAVIRSADIAGAYSDLSSTSADLAIAKRQMDNQAALYKNGIASEREYNEAKENYNKALAAKNKVQSGIAINGGGSANASGTYTLTAPIDGYVVERKVNAGAFIRPDAGDNLFTISDLKNVWIYANVYEGDVPKVKERYEVEVHPLAYPDKTFTGRIDKISQVLDPQSKALRARITLANPDLLLKPDMFTRVTINNREGTQGLAIPSSALINQDGKDFVVLYNSNSDMKIVPVEVIKTVDNQTFIRSGTLQPGQRLITKYQNLVFAELLNY